jgi:acyl carrier protein
MLDALALHRRAQGLPGASIAWGPWDTGMMARLDSRLRERLAGQGFGLLTEDTAFAALETALAGPGGHSAVAALDWRRYLARFPAAGNVAAGAEPAAAAGLDELVGRLAEAAPADRHALAPDYLLALLAARLGLKAADLEPAGSLSGYGMDSMLAVEIRGQIREDLGVELPLSALLDVDTVAELADQLQTQFGGGPRPVGPAAQPQAGAPRALPAGEITAEAAEQLLAGFAALTDTELAEIESALAADEESRP